MREGSSSDRIAEEAEVMMSMYPDEFAVRDARTWSLTLDACSLTITLPAGYPSDAPPLVALSRPPALGSARRQREEASLRAALGAAWADRRDVVVAEIPRLCADALAPPAPVDAPGAAGPPPPPEEWRVALVALDHVRKRARYEKAAAAKLRAQEAERARAALDAETEPQYE